MGYFTGTASTPADLLSKLKTHLSVDLPGAEQWTVEGDVIYKGTCFMEINAFTNYLRIIGGTSQAGGVMSGIPFKTGGFDRHAALASNQLVAMVYPAIYFLNTNTDIHDEIWLTVKNGDEYCHLAFGQSPAVSLPGSGNWYFAQIPLYHAAINSGQGFLSSGEQQDTKIGTSTAVNNDEAGAIFGTAASAGGSTGNSKQGLNYSMQTGMDGNLWTNVGTDNAGTEDVSSWGLSEAMLIGLPVMAGLYMTQPNSFNGQAILINPPLIVHRGDFKSSIVGQINIMRFMRMDFYQPEDILTIGPDKWQIFPCIKRDPANPGGHGSNRQSGFHAYAIRYTGP